MITKAKNWTSIYVLVNNTGDIFYVGKTQMSIESRKDEHKYACYLEKNKQKLLVKYLILINYDFSIREIEKVKNRKIVTLREKFWINKMHQLKNPILNFQHNPGLNRIRLTYNMLSNKVKIV